ncbi:hypothetical protein, conserved [Eimeria tenella]|uniref:Uncharacterized protein n=1 Tax=Eimeria tenella TaxID=5802 RepID=U6L452_EIMTE|nr:hypothetical protein, conserved [Eimeria tenella]CDJ42540.1 hypothetical protein, conserved [Eimeria tenella]|eukprot:XP_013233290.1 hypothetical protein, conserved [Eimeria tenella]
MRCLNSRSSSADFPQQQQQLQQLLQQQLQQQLQQRPRWLLLQEPESPTDFVPQTAAAAAAAATATTAERQIRLSVRQQLLRRHKWRWAGIPVAAAAAAAAARKAASATWWLSCFIKCIGLLCCDRRLRPRREAKTLMSCNFELQNKRNWMPLLPEPMEFDESQQREAVAAYETTRAAATAAAAPGADEAATAEAAEAAAAAAAAQALQVWGADATRVALLPPIGSVSPRLSELHFTAADTAAAAAEVEQQLQASLQQLLQQHYSEAPVFSASSRSSSSSSSNRWVQQQLLFAAEPHEAVYEVLSSYEEARCTNSWSRLLPGQCEASTAAAAATAAAATAATTEHMLQEALRLAVASCFPGRPLRGLVLHFKELDANKLLQQLLHAKIFDQQQQQQQQQQQSVTCCVCLVLRLFSYPCGLYSGWLFAAALD